MYVSRKSLWPGSTEGMQVYAEAPRVGATIPTRRYHARRSAAAHRLSKELQIQGLLSRGTQVAHAPHDHAQKCFLDAARKALEDAIDGTSSYEATIEALDDHEVALQNMMGNRFMAGPHMVGPALCTACPSRLPVALGCPGAMG